MASPMQYRLGTTLPALSVTCIRSLTGTNPRLSVSTPSASSPRPAVYGARPVATSTASTSSVSTTSFVLKSVSSILTGLTPGTPGVTLVASTPVCQSIRRGLISSRCARRAISRSKPGIRSSIASMNVTSDPSAV